MAKQIQIPRELFIKLFLLVNDLQHNHEIDFDNVTNINNQLNNKLNSLIKREIFSRYKNSPPGSAEREAALREYLEKIGLPQWIQPINEPDKKFD